LLAQPTAQLPAHRFLQAAGVFVAAHVDQLNVMQQPGLEAQQVVEIGCDAIAKGFRSAAQTGEQGNEPADQTDRRPEDRPCAAAGDGHSGGLQGWDGLHSVTCGKRGGLETTFGRLTAPDQSCRRPVLR
jgi:hypothetical protein